MLCRRPLWDLTAEELEAIEASYLRLLHVLSRGSIADAIFFRLCEVRAERFKR